MSFVTEEKTNNNNNRLLLDACTQSAQFYFYYSVVYRSFNAGASRTLEFASPNFGA